MAAAQRKRNDFRQEFLTCSICSHRFNDKDRLGKCLPCLHCFCVSCLRHTISGKPFLHCPNCRQKHLVPVGGADGFVTNFNIKNLREYQHLHQEESDGDYQLCTSCTFGGNAVGYCYDCEDYVCQSCFDSHKTLNVLKLHELVSLEDIRKQDHHKQKRRRQERCRDHRNKCLSAFCKTCNKLICDTCGITDHSDHKKQDLHKAMDEVVNVLQELSIAVRSKKKATEKLSAMIDKRMSETKSLFGQREDDINELFQRLQKKIEDRCRKALEELHGRRQILTKRLEEQEADVEALQAQYDSACDFADQTCELASSLQLFKHNEMISHQLQKLKSESILLDEPVIICHVEFDEDHEESLKLLEEQCISRIGRIRVRDVSVSQYYHLDEDIKSRVTIGTPQVAIIRAVNSKSIPQDVGGDSVTAMLQTPDGTSIACQIQDINDGAYRVTYTATEPGTHHLDVRVFGNPIKESPFSFQTHVGADNLESNSSHYQPIGVDIPVAFAGHQHEILVNLSREDGHREKEARVDRVKATISTKTGELVKSLLSTTDEGYRIRYTPPFDDQLDLRIWINDIPAIGNPYSISVLSASLEATGVAFDRQPIANQMWSIVVKPRDFRQTPNSVSADDIQVTVTNAVTKRVQALTCKTNQENDLIFTCIPSRGSHLVKVTLYNVAIADELVKVQQQLEIKLSDTPQSFPTSIVTGTDNAVFVSDTADGNIRHFCSDDMSRQSQITLNTDNSSQMAVDNQGVLLLLFPKTRMVHCINQQGKELNKWPCHPMNSRPVTITSSKGGRVIIADSKSTSMYIYKSDGSILYIKNLPEKSVVDGVNNICVDKRNNVLLAHHNKGDIYTYDSNGHQLLQFPSGTTSFQLAIASTREDFLVVAQLGSIIIMHFVGDKAATFVGDIPVANDHIYTSLASTSNGCILGLDVEQKQLVQYGCHIDKQNTT